MKRLLILGCIMFCACCGSKTIVDCHQMAVTVSDRALEVIDRGHYTGACLYSGMADIVTLCGDKAEEEKLLDILHGLTSGEISAGGGSFINYQVGGQAAAYLSWKGLADLGSAVEANAADMWANQYRTTDDLMTGNKQEDRFRDAIWIDCAFTVTPFFLYAGLLTGNKDYVEYAADYALRLYHIFYDASTGLVFQARSYNDLADGELSADNWSRGEGWLSMAMVALLRDYPADGPRRAEIEQVARDFYAAVLKYQDADGMWHQEVSDSTTFVETSGSALLLAGIGQAIESGILPEDNLPDFKRGLIGLMAYIEPDGSVGHTCMGTLAPGKAQKEDYAIRHFYFNDSHAFGPVVLALAQALRLGIKQITIPGQLGEKNNHDRPRCYVRYVPERKGDVAWENDFTAFRVYSLDVAEKSRTLSGVDMWPKSVDYSIIDTWYALDAAGQPYHIDRGQGCDFYMMGNGRGIGGTGVWAEDTLWTSRNYSAYEILRNDPSHIAFTLEYEPYQAGSVTVTEHKRIDMVQGTPFFKITSTLETSDGSDVILAVGLTDFGAAQVLCLSREKGMVSLDERLAVPDSTVHPCGLKDWTTETAIFSAVAADPARVVDIVHGPKDMLVLQRVKSGDSVVSYAGAVWNQQYVRGGRRVSAAVFSSIVEASDWMCLNKLYEL